MHNFFHYMLKYTSWKVNCYRDKKRNVSTIKQRLKEIRHIRKNKYIKKCWNHK